MVALRSSFSISAPLVRVALFHTQIQERMVTSITQNEFKQVFEQQVDLCRVLLTRKTKEYTGDNTDRLSAFKAAAALQSCTPERALAGMLAKLLKFAETRNYLWRPEFCQFSNGRWPLKNGAQ